jgi:endonuclease YncB( thermonuclease family)
VLSIYDGDTMTVACAGQKKKVRLYCIDAPEMGQEPWGRESRDHLRAITPPTVRLVVRDRDRYGREVAEVIVPDDSEENLNRAQVWAGQAAVYRRYCSEDSYIEAEYSARQMPAGVWQKPGSHQTPWIWRH